MNLKELVKKVEGELKISQVKGLEFSFIKEIVEVWNLVAEDKENWKSNDLVPYGWKIRSIERLYATEHQEYIPILNESLLSYLERLPKKVIIETDERLKTKGFTDEEIGKIEEYARRKLGHYSEPWWEHKYEIGQDFKVYLFFYEDIPSFFYRELVDDGILWFKISRIDGGSIFVKCIDIKLD